MKQVLIILAKKVNFSPMTDWQSVDPSGRSKRCLKKTVARCDEALTQNRESAVSNPARELCVFLFLGRHFVAVSLALLHCL